jgi:hypothetical protein
MMMHEPQTIEDLMREYPYFDGHPDAGWVNLHDAHPFAPAPVLRAPRWLSGADEQASEEVPHG